MNTTGKRCFDLFLLGQSSLRIRGLSPLVPPHAFRYRGITSNVGTVRKPTARKAGPSETSSPHNSQRAAAPPKSVGSDLSGPITASASESMFKNTKAAPKQQPTKSSAEQLRIVEQAMSMSHLYPTVDPWSMQSVGTLDVDIPSLYSRKNGATMRDHASCIIRCTRNWAKNVHIMFTLGGNDAFPGIAKGAALSPSYFTPRSHSNKWLRPFKQIAYDTYRQIGEAIAKGDEKTIKRLTTAAYQDETLKLIRRRSSRHPRIIKWQLLGQRSPTEVLSVRAIQAVMSREPPRYGHRYLVQILVKFDTFQTIQTFTKDGTLLTSKGEVAVNQKKQPSPKPVVQYMVFEKRGWYESPWVVREQIYPDLPPNFDIAT